MANKLQATIHSQIDDLEAINSYMRSKLIVNNKAFPIKDSFIAWYDNLGFWDKNYNGKVYDEARSRRNQFSLANVNTPAELEHVQNVLATGQTTEQMAGKERPPINITTGAVGTQVKNPTVPGLASGSVPFTGGIGRGSTATEKVKQWQKFLGINPPTGFFLDFTEKKTKAYQLAQGLPVTGVVDSATWNKAFPPAKAADVIITHKDAAAIKASTVPMKEAIKLAAEKKPIPQVKVKEPSKAAKEAAFPTKKKPPFAPPKAVEAKKKPVVFAPPKKGDKVIVKPPKKEDKKERRIDLPKEKKSISLASMFDLKNPITWIVSGLVAVVALLVVPKKGTTASTKKSEASEPVAKAA